MPDPATVEKAAQALERAWAITRRNARGPVEKANEFLAWLDRHHVDGRSPLWDLLDRGQVLSGTPIAISSCGELATMRWYVHRDLAVACDTECRLFLIPLAALGGMPDVELDGVGPDGTTPYEHLI